VAEFDNNEITRLGQFRYSHIRKLPVFGQFELLRTF
jgi:hypothetical protein